MTGTITPSRFADMMQRGKGGQPFGQAAITYAEELALARMGVEMPQPDAFSFRWGREYEPHAIAAFEEQTGMFVQPCSRIFSTELPYVSGEPDGLVGDNAIIEVKCPSNPRNHFANLRTGAQIIDYHWQMQGYLWLTGRSLCYFVSYDPRFPADKRLAIHQVLRVDAAIDQLRERCVEFENLIQSLL